MLDEVKFMHNKMPVCTIHLLIGRPEKISDTIVCSVRFLGKVYHMPLVAITYEEAAVYICKEVRTYGCDVLMIHH